jgi:formiminoglutamate deiminase
MSPSPVWCERAWLGGDGVAPGVLLGLDGGRIASVTPDVNEPPSNAERLAGLVLPGFANAHSHAFHRALRGRTQSGHGSFWVWRERMYELAAALDPDRYEALARATFAEMALAGFTSVGEFHYLHHAPGGTAYEEPNEIGLALIRAAGDAGIRITLLDTCYLHGGIGEEPNAIQRRFSDGSAEAWAERVTALAERELPDHARIGAAIHSIRAVDPGSATLVSDWATARGAPVHAHLSEQRAENEECLAEYGRTPAGVLDGAGVIHPGFTAVHATHLAEGDIALLGKGGVTCCLCPTTERDLADGIGPAARLAAAGAALAVGSDSHAVIDPFEEARAVELDQRLQTGERGHHGPAALLEAATAAGHAATGWPEAGRIEPGALADLVAIDVDGVRIAGTDWARAVASVVFAATAADVRDVVVGGALVVRDGRHLSCDVAGELRDAIDPLES